MVMENPCNPCNPWSKFFAAGEQSRLLQYGGSGLNLAAVPLTSFH